MKGFLLCISIIFLFSAVVNSQTGKPVVIATDSTTQTKNPAFTKDTGIVVVNGDTLKVVPKHDPRKATFRSLVLPGWGQAYNKEYWKIPIVYGALGTVAGFYIYNTTWYNRTKKAYVIKLENDTANFINIHSSIRPLSAQSLLQYRNTFRRDRDYTVLYFLLAWGLNIADATVFAHLKDFDVSEDLSLQINPVIKQNGSAGFSLVLGLKPRKKYTLSVPKHTVF